MYHQVPNMFVVKHPRILLRFIWKFPSTPLTIWIPIRFGSTSMWRSTYVSDTKSKHPKCASKRNHWISITHGYESPLFLLQRIGNTYTTGHKLTKCCTLKSRMKSTHFWSVWAILNTSVHAGHPCISAVTVQITPWRESRGREYDSYTEQAAFKHSN